MKKAVIWLLSVVLAGMMFTGCGAQTPSANKDGEPAQIVGENAGEKHEAAANEKPASGGTEQPQPIYGNQLKDGTYKIEVSSSSSMFRIVDAQLTVAGGKMTAVLTLSGKGYEKLYMGTGQEALADTDDKCIYYVENEAGKYTYKVPVTALDQDINCAAWSIRKQKWYDRVLVFQSGMIPGDAITAD